MHALLNSVSALFFLLKRVMIPLAILALRVLLFFAAP